MTVKLKLIIVILFVLLAGFLSTCTYLYYKEKHKTATLENNIRNGYEKGFKIVDYYKAKNGELVARNQILEFSSSQLKNNISPEVSAELDNLGVKPRKVEFYSETAVNNQTSFTVNVKDSVVFDTVPCSVFHYRDDFYNVYGIKVGDKQTVNICSQDSLIQVVYRGSRFNKKGKKMPGIFFWLPRRLEQVISCKNPHSKVVYSKTIMISHN